jgi:N-acyl-D-amino-acid deacylase
MSSEKNNRPELSLLPAVLIIAIVLISSCNNQEYDLIIRNGLIIDGSGSEGIWGNIGIRDGLIVNMDVSQKATAKREIDAAGLVVAPGFIDIHTHCDWGLANPGKRSNLNYLKQGVTTVGTGNCGIGTPDLADLIKSFETPGIGTNVVHFTGLGSLLEAVGVNTTETPSANQLAEMKTILKQSMEAGSWGFSTGLQYRGQMLVSTDQLIELSKVIVPFDGLYNSHMRSEEEELYAAVKEAIKIGQASGARVNIAHLKANGRENWVMMDQVISLVNQERGRGLDITADMYPYHLSAGMQLYRVLLIPESLHDLSAKHKELGNSNSDLPASERIARFLDALVEELNNRNSFELIRVLTEKGIPGEVNWVAKGGWNYFTILNTPETPVYEGRMFCDMAEETGRMEFEIAAEILIKNKEKAIIALSTMTEENIHKQMGEDWVMISSDGVSMPESPLGTHPRSFGSFPRVLRKYVNETNTLSLEEAVYKMTSLPANTIGLSDRGEIKPGMAADIVIFNPVTIRDNATYLDPIQYSDGIVSVIVNGEVAVDAGKFTDIFPGRVLQKPQF